MRLCELCAKLCFELCTELYGEGKHREETNCVDNILNNKIYSAEYAG